MRRIGNTFSFTRFVTKNFVSDILQNWRDIFGYEQKGYTELINKTSEEMLLEIHKHGDVKWFRQHIDRTFESAIQVTIYGEYKQVNSCRNG